MKNRLKAIMDKVNETSEEISVLSGTFYGTLGIICRIVFLFFVNLFLARFLGAEDFGIWSISFIFATLGNTLVLFGLEKGISRFIGKYRANEEKNKIVSAIEAAAILIFGASFLFSLLLFLLSNKIALLFNIKDLSLILKITSLSFLPAAVIEIAGAIFQGYENIKISRFINSFIPSFLFFVSMIFLLLEKKITLINASFAYLFTNCIGGIIAVIFLVSFLRKKEIKVSLKSMANSANAMKNILLSFSLPLLVFNLTNNVGIYSDSLIISFMLGAKKVGIYNVAFRIARLSSFFVLGSLDVFVPLVSKNMAKKSNNGFSLNDIYYRSSKWLSFATLLIVITIIVFPRFFLGFFGQEFLEGSFALRLLLLSFLIQAFLGPVDAINMALGDTKFVAGCSALQILFITTFCLIFIPNFGIEGAALSSILSALIVKPIALLKLKIKDKVNILTKKYVSFAICSVISGLILGFFIRDYVSAGFFGVMIFFFFYLIIQLLILKSMDFIDEKDFLLKDFLILRLSRILGKNI